MYPVNIDWWIFKVQGYEGHWVLLTLAIGYVYQRHRSLKAGYSRSWFTSAFFAAVLMGFVGARTFHYIFWDTDRFLRDPMILITGTGGFAILGATIGTAFGGWLYCKKTKVNFLHWCDSLMIPICLGLTLSRFACFLNGDAYGLPTNIPWGLVFSEESHAFTAHWKSLHKLYANHPQPLNVISQIFKGQVNLADIPLPQALAHLKAEGVENLAQLSRFYPPAATGDYQSVLKAKGLMPFPVVYPPVHPTQLYEVGIMFLALLFMMKIDGKGWTIQRQFFIFWFLYGLNRLFIEVFRGDRNIAFGNLTYAQLISLTVLILGAFGYVYSTMKWKKTGIPEPVLK